MSQFNQNMDTSERSWLKRRFGESQDLQEPEDFSQLTEPSQYSQLSQPSQLTDEESQDTAEITIVPSDQSFVTEQSSQDTMETEPEVVPDCANNPPAQIILDKFGRDNCNKYFIATDNSNPQQKYYLGLECINNMVSIKDLISARGDEFINRTLKKNSCQLRNHLNNYTFENTDIQTINQMNTQMQETSAMFPTESIGFFDLVFAGNPLDDVDSIFNVFNTGLKVRENVNETPLPETIIQLPNISKESPTTLEDFIYNHPNSTILKSIVYCFSFIRSYIDFYHDFEYLSINILKDIKSLLSITQSEIIQGFNTDKNNQIQITFKDSGNTTSTVMDYLMKSLDYIDSQVVTSSGNVNQTTCKKLIKAYMEIYCKTMISYGVYWLTPDKESAFVCSANTCSVSDSICNAPPSDAKTTCPCEPSSKELEILIDKLNEDEIYSFYTETDKSHISEFFSKKGFKNVVSKSGKWDAGSGFSEKSYIKYNPNPDAKTNPDYFRYIYRKYLPNDRYSVNLVNNQYHINYNNDRLVSQYLFLNLFKIIVDNDNSANSSKITIVKQTTTGDNNEMSLTAQNEKKIPVLSVNALLATANMTQLRGQGNASKLPVQGNVDAAALLSLKTYTDFIQLLDIHDIKGKEKCVFITLDYLCEDSGMLFGLPTIRSEPNFVSYYCYDTRYHNVSPITMKRKLYVFLRTVKNAGLIKHQITEGIFKPIRQYLERIRKVHFNPSIYYAANFLLNEINEIYVSAISKIDEILAKYEYFKSNPLDLNYIKIFPLDNEKFNIWKKSKGFTTDDQIDDISLQQFNADFESYIENICEFSRIKGTLMNTSNVFMTLMTNIVTAESRPTVEKFENFYNNIKQELINYLVKDTAEDVINFNIAVIFSTLISAKPLKQQTNITINIGNFSEYLKSKQIQANAQIQDLENKKDSETDPITINEINRLIEEKNKEITSAQNDIYIMGLILAFIDILNNLFEAKNDRVKSSELDILLGNIDKRVDILYDTLDKHYNNKTILTDQQISDIEGEIQTLKQNRHEALEKHINEEIRSEERRDIPYKNEYFNNSKYYEYYESYRILMNQVDVDKIKIFFHILPYQLIYNILDESFNEFKEGNIKRKILETGQPIISNISSIKLVTKEPIERELLGGLKKRTRRNKRTKKGGKKTRQQKRARPAAPAPAGGSKPPANKKTRGRRRRTLRKFTHKR